jgi:hypothetical protein
MKYFIAFFMFLALTLCNAQKQDSVPVRLNTIKFNLVSSALFKNSAVLSYERVTKPNQSFAVMAGVVFFPTFRDFGSTIKVKDDTKKNGFVFGGEYRFYLAKENKYAAPHGVHVGPYINYFHFLNDRSLTFTSSDGQTTSNALLSTEINILNIGAQLGYQFIIGNRWAIDLIFIGPSVSQYGMKVDLGGGFDADEEAILENEIVAALVKRFPLIKDLITDQTVQLHGTTQQWSAGFRYQMNVGYHFGRKKKG